MKKLKPAIYTIKLPTGEPINVDKAAHEFIVEQNSKIKELEFENSKLHGELNAIKPIIETGKLEPAVSVYCKDCKFVIKSRWNNNLIGCCKNSVCMDFRSNDE